MVPVPNHVMGIVSTCSLWVSIVVVLYDFGFAVSNWVLLAVLTLAVVCYEVIRSRKFAAERELVAAQKLAKQKSQLQSKDGAVVTFKERLPPLTVTFQPLHASDLVVMSKEFEDQGIMFVTSDAHLMPEEKADHEDKEKYI